MRDGVCCVRAAPLPEKGEDTLAQSTGGDPLARARRILSDGRGTTRTGRSGGGGDGRAGGARHTKVINVTSLDTKEYIILIR